MKTIVKLEAVSDYREPDNMRPNYVGRDLILCNPDIGDINEAMCRMAEEFPYHVVSILSVKEEEGI